MARVNMEDSLATEGHLSKLARTMGWNEREAVGALYFVYRSTQHAKIVADTLDRLITVCVLRFDSDEQAAHFIGAMVSAQLAVVLEDGRIHIRGNGDHVERLEAWRTNASKGGKRSGEVRRKKANDSLSSGFVLGSQHEASVNTPSSLLLSDPSNEASAPGPTSGETLTHSANGDLVKSQKAKRGSRKSGTNPRAKGTNPRAKRRAAKERARIAKLEEVKAKHTGAQPPNEEGLAEIAALKKKLRL